jgi:hypothetical protein
VSIETVGVCDPHGALYQIAVGFILGAFCVWFHVYLNMGKK